MSWTARALGIILIATGLVFVPLSHEGDSAVAANLGAGYDDPDNGGYGRVKQYRLDNGQAVYCLDMDAPTPNGFATDGGGIVGGFNSYTGVSRNGWDMRRLNYIVTNYGQTWDNNQAAAVQLAVWAIGDPGTFNQAHGSSGVTGIASLIYRVPSSQRNAVRDTFNRYMSESENYANNPGISGGSARVNIVMTNGYDGYVDISTNPNVPGTINLGGAVTTYSGQSSMGITGSTRIGIRGIPQDSTGKYSITARADFSTSAGLADNVRLHNTPGKQRLVGPGTASTASWSSNSFVTDPIDVTFRPQVTTAVSNKYVQPGENFSDRVTFSLAPGSERWRQSGTTGAHREVRARGTLYGPFDSQPAESASVPAGAPVAGTATITSGSTGPGTYTATSSNTAAAGGFYTWVWTIAQSDQTAATRAALPDGYTYADRFGLVAETSVVPFAVQGTSQVTDEEIPLAGTVGDALTFTAPDGAWQKINGQPVPVNLRATAFFVEGDPSVQPKQHPLPAPANAEVLTSSIVTVTGPGTVSAAERATAPSHRIGHIVWVWEIRSEDQLPQYRQHVRPWADEFGIPAETTRVLPQTVEGVSKIGLVDDGIPYPEREDAEEPSETPDVPRIGGQIVPLGGELRDSFITSFRDGLGNELEESPLAITLRATSYFQEGDSFADLVTSATVPAEAEQIQTETFTVTESGQIFTTAPIVAPANRTGHVTVVWCVDPADQPEENRAALIPWCDAYGLPDETAAVRPMTFDGVSQIEVVPAPSDDDTAPANTIAGEPATSKPVTDTIVPLSGHLADTLTHVIRDGLDRDIPESTIPVVYRAMSYFLPGNPDLAPTQQATAPEGAELIQEELFTTSTPGSLITTKPIQAPANREGHVVVQWCVLVDDQPVENQGALIEWCDDWGVPTETASVHAPSVTTQAVPDVVLHAEQPQSAHDVATVAGVIPAVDSYLSFEAFVGARGPIDPGTGQPILPTVPDVDEPVDGESPAEPGTDAGETPTDPDAEVPADGEEAPEFVQPVIGPVCTTENLVWSSTDSIVVNARGKYTSASFVPEDIVPVQHLTPAGSSTPVEVWWVATLRAPDGSVIDQGPCAAETETTFLHNPEISSMAVLRVASNEEAHDTAFIDGTLGAAGGQFTWAAYLQPEFLDEPTCTTDTRVYTSKNAEPVVDGQRAYDSPSTRLPVGEVLWVKTLSDSAGNVLRVGDCGAEGQTTWVLELPETGISEQDSSFIGMGWLAAGLLVLLGALVIAATHLQRTQEARRGATTDHHTIETFEPFKELNQ